MTTPPTTDVREWLRQHHPDKATDRGRISGEGMALYTEAHPPLDDDYDAGVTAADFPPDEPEKPASETKPRRVRTTRPRARSKLTAWLTGEQDGKEGKSRKRFPRVKLDKLVERAWSQLAEAAPVLPLEKMLYAQAPFAGLVLEDTLKGTVVDKVLQPVARAEEKAEAIGGLLGPPMFIMGVMATAPPPCQACDGAGGLPVNGEPGLMQACPACRGSGSQPASMQHRAMMGGLKMSLMAMSETMGGRLEEVQQRAAVNKERARKIDRFIEWLFDMPAGEAPSEMEDEAIRRAQEMAGPDTMDG